MLFRMEVKKYLSDRNWSVRKLAAASGISHSTISRWLRNDGGLSGASLHRLARFIEGKIVRPKRAQCESDGVYIKRLEMYVDELESKQ